MKDLKQYIEESLLDDFDTLANNIDPYSEIKQFLQTNYINTRSKFVISKKPNEKGLYEVVINLIEWDREKGMRLEDGSSHPDALPDFVIEINRILEKKKKYNTDIHTFGKIKTSK